jgi:thiamine biosynthesis lipoprotein
MQRFEHSFTAMGGPCRLRLDCDDSKTAECAIGAAEAEVRRLESKYSRYLPDSLTSKINRLAGSKSPVAIDAETAGLLHHAQTLWQESDGRFDLTSGVLRRAWDFKSSRLPSQKELDALLPLIGWDTVEWDDKQLRLPQAGMELDFGGCVKEYACDSALGVLGKHGIEYALVDLAGDIAALGGQCDGTVPVPEGTHEVDRGAAKPWQIGIRDPGGHELPIAYVPLINGGLASSGNYERFMEIDGWRYGHILDPKTGWPIQGLVAVSIVAEQCLVAGSAATLALLMPEMEALAWLDSLGLPWLAVDAQLGTHGPVA